MFEVAEDPNDADANSIHQTPDKLLQILNPCGILGPDSSTCISLLFTPNQVGFM